MKRLSVILYAAALLLSHVMCAVVAWEYCSLLWCGRYGGCSAPAYVALFMAIPFLAVIAVCLIGAHLASRRRSREE